MRSLLAGVLALFFATAAAAQDGAEDEPPPPTDHAADRIYDPKAMAVARTEVHQGHGGETYSMVLINLAEYQAMKGANGYRWEGEAWYGGDIHRVVFKTEGEGVINGGTEHAEGQLLYSRAVGPYFNLQAGVRYDFKPDLTRAYATVGIEGLAPGLIETQAALFVSNKGDLLGHIEAYYDQLMTQQLVVQPRVEINLAAQDVREHEIGAGLSDIELGLRLRYEVRREFAPYIGVSYSRKTGNTAAYARAGGEGVSSTRFVVGIRTWF